MEELLVYVVIAAFTGFGLGVLFHKYVVSEADSIKEHVSAEVGELRDAVDSLVEEAKGDVHRAAADVSQGVQGVANKL